MTSRERNLDESWPEGILAETEDIKAQRQNPLPLYAA